MTALTSDEFLRLCSVELDRAGDVCKAARALGGLAPWMLKPEALREAALSDPAGADFYLRPRHLPPDSGSCGIIFVGDQSLPLLRSACLLPLVWKRGADDGKNLPPSVQALAEQVRKDVKGEVNGAWSLHLAAVDGIDQLNLGKLDERIFSASSGWAAVAAGLLLAAEGSKPDPLVLATGVWDPQQGLQPVEASTLEAKVNCAREYGAKWLFVPQRQRFDAEDYAGKSAGQPPPQIGEIFKEPQPSKALRSLLAACAAWPLADDPKDARGGFYVRQMHRDRANAQAFYRERVMAGIVDDCRKDLASRSLPSFTHLVTFVSYNWEAIPLAIGAIRPEQCLMIHTSGMKEILHRVTRFLQDKQKPWSDCQTVVEEIADELVDDLDRLSQRIGALIGRHFSDIPPHRIAIDLTPGLKSMSLAALRIAHRKTWMLYLNQKYVGRDIRAPGSERYQCMQAEEFFRNTRGAGPLG